MSVPELIAEEPPAYRGAGPGSPLPAWLQEIRSHPGQWFRYPDTIALGTLNNINQGRYKGTAAGDYETRTTAAEQKPRRNLWARYVGNETGGAA